MYPLRICNLLEAGLVAKSRIVINSKYVLSSLLERCSRAPICKHSRIKSIEVSYKDFDKGTLRRFQCRSFENNTETEPATNSFIRLGRSKTPAYFDEENTVLDGTCSDSIEAITFVGGPAVESDYTIDKRFDSFNMQDPQFMSLAITATPQELKELNLMLQGQLPTTGAMSLHAGVSPLQRRCH